MRTVILATGTTVREFRLGPDHKLANGAAIVSHLEPETKEHLESFCRTFGPMVPNDPACVLVFLRGATFLLGSWLANQSLDAKVYAYPEDADIELEAFVDGYRQTKGDLSLPRLFGGNLDHPCLTGKNEPSARYKILTKIDEESYEDLVALAVAGARVAVEVLSPERVDMKRLASDIAASLPCPSWTRDGRDTIASLWACGQRPMLQAHHFVSDGSYQSPYQADFIPTAVSRAANGIYLHEDVDHLTHEEDHHLLSQSRFLNRTLGLKWPAAPRLFIGVTQSLSSRRKVFPFRWDAGIYLYMNRQDDAIEVDTLENRQRVEELELEYSATFPGRSFMSLKQQEVGIESGSALASRYMLALREVFGVDKAASVKRARRILWGLK